MFGNFAFSWERVMSIWTKFGVFSLVDSLYICLINAFYLCTRHMIVGEGWGGGGEG